MRDCLGICAAEGLVWLSPRYIWYIREKAQATTAVCHADFLPRRPFCKVYWSHLWHEQSRRGRIELATMSAWKHLSVWLIYQAEVKYLARRHLMSWLPRTSISYPWEIMEGILLHCNSVTCHRGEQPCASSLLSGLQVWSDASSLLWQEIPPTHPQRNPLRASTECEANLKKFTSSAVSWPCRLREEVSGWQQQNEGWINFIYQLAPRQNGCIIISLVPLPPIISPLLNTQLKPD